MHYYSLQKGQTQPHMLVMADSSAGFLPASAFLSLSCLLPNYCAISFPHHFLGRDVFMVPFDEDHRPLVETLLNKLPTMWGHNIVTGSATGAAVQSAVLALRNSGGRIVLVQVR